MIEYYQDQLIQLLITGVVLSAIFLIAMGLLSRWSFVREAHPTVLCLVGAGLIGGALLFNSPDVGSSLQFAQWPPALLGLTVYLAGVAAGLSRERVNRTAAGVYVAGFVGLATAVLVYWGALDIYESSLLHSSGLGGYLPHVGLATYYGAGPLNIVLANLPIALIALLFLAGYWKKRPELSEAGFPWVAVPIGLGVSSLAVVVAGYMLWYIGGVHWLTIGVAIALLLPLASAKVFGTSQPTGLELTTHPIDQEARGDPKRVTAETKSLTQREISRLVMQRINEGDRTLSVSALSEELGVAPEEIQAAIDDLVRRGLLRL